MTKALDAATAACRIVLEIHHGPTAEDFARAAFHAALPAEPAEQALEAIAMALCSDPADECRAVYHALRAHLLGEDA